MHNFGHKHIITFGIAAVVLVLIGAGIYGAAANRQNGNFVQNELVCRNFCSLSNTEFGFINSQQDCNCIQTQTQIDLKNDAIIQWKTIVNAGKIANLTVPQPIPEDIRKAAEQQQPQQ